MTGLGTRLAEYLPLLMAGAYTTTLATILATVLATAIGIVVAVMRMSGPAVIRMVAYAYIETFRNTPPLVQLFVIFYLMPRVGVVLPPLMAGILAIGLYMGAYLAEVFRGSIESVPRGQWEAATILSMPRGLMWRRVILPQALRKVVPPWGNYFIGAFKQTALLSVITVEELMYQARIIANSNFRYFELFTLATILYFAMSYPAILSVRHLERRLLLRGESSPVALRRWESQAT